MKHALRSVPVLLTIFFVVWGSSSASAQCTREGLKGFIEKYFAALEAHNASSLPLASTMKFTENGKELAVGKGFWETGGKPLLKRSLIDTQKCGTHTQAVMEENGRPILYGFRLKIDNEKITEIESIIAREKEFAFNAKGVLATKDQD